MADLHHIFRIFLALVLIYDTSAGYKVGVGISDITGPPIDIPFVGFVRILDQLGSGIHMRQFARAFIIEDDDQNVTAFVITETCMMGNFVKDKVIENLGKNFGTRYTDKNVVISSTHTHSTPGGYMKYMIPDVSNEGFSQETFQAIVDGVIQAITAAHNMIQPARIFINLGKIPDANINRSPTSYEANPDTEKAEYPDGNTGKEMTQLSFTSTNGTLIGAISWFPVHATSMNNTNTLVSSDNLGYAAYSLEKSLNFDALPGMGPVITAFAQTYHGDISPNTDGPKCQHSGFPCTNNETSKCGQSEFCILKGPGTDMFSSTKIIGTKLMQKASELINGASQEIVGPVGSSLQYISMPDQNVQYLDGNGTLVQGQGCRSALGAGFGAGTMDGLGLPFFYQGMTAADPVAGTIGLIWALLFPADTACHAPKPILLPTGGATIPYPWHPQIVPIQVVRIGQVIIIPVPGEFTTMAGRRLKKHIKFVALNAGAPNNTVVIISGLSNIYIHYVTTIEEYQKQRFEAASTLFGPHTLGILTENYKNITSSLLKGIPVAIGQKNPDFSAWFSLVPPPLDYITVWYGQCTTQPSGVATFGDTVTAVFTAGNPRNNLLHGSSYLSIQREISSKWITIATDSDWETKFNWKAGHLFAPSTATVEWTIPEGTLTGSHRICHRGYGRTFMNSVPSCYEGCSKDFSVQ